MTTTTTATPTDAQIEASVRRLLTEVAHRSALPVSAAPCYERAVSVIAEEVTELLATLVPRP